MSKAEEVLAASYEKLLEFALSHHGDPDTMRIPQLEAERDAALTKARNLEGVRADLKFTQDVLNRERGEHDQKVRELETQLEHTKSKAEESGFTIAQLESDLEMAHARFKQMQAELDKPRVNPEWEDLDRFISTAIENFDADPEKALKNLTRAHLALQGKEPVEEQSA